MTAKAKPKKAAKVEAEAKVKLEDLENLSTDEIIELYPKILKELKKRGVIKSKNLIGDIGEYSAIQHYNKTPNLPNLKDAATGTANIDAVSRAGERYSIKSTSSSSTGTFWGLEPPNSKKRQKQAFEYVVIVRFNDDYSIQHILEITWKQFMKIKRWHTHMKAYNVPITANLMKIAKKVL